MNLKYVLIFLLSIFMCSCHQENDFQDLFNGHDLSGWTNVNGAPTTWRVKDQMIVCSGIPSGVLRTTQQYENFILEVEWRHMEEDGNAGVFIHSDALPAPGQPFTRAIECQVMDGNHGDVFAIHGATMKPDRPHPQGWMRSLPAEERAKPTGEWNHYRIESRDGRISLAVNGKVVSGGFQSNPRKGYICLESEGSEVHFRNIRIQELPSTHPEPHEIATLDQGFVSLYNGVDLSQWEMKPGHQGHWTAQDWKLDYDGKSEEQDKCLWSRKSYKDFELIADVRLTREPETTMLPVVLPNGENATLEDGSEKQAPVAYAGDTGIYLRGSSKSQVNIGIRNIGSGEIYGYRVDKKLSPEVRASVVPKVKADHPPGEWNRFIITMKDKRVSIELNNQEVIQDALLPGIPDEGPIALQDDHAEGNTFQFANLFIKELK
ncbi:hypothetical protein OKW21_001501 [Catalinimonas alkaloidigena]|nr:hypothetical protein [Catalinimonas alkaloidigena]